MALSWEEFKRTKLKEFGSLPFESGELAETQKKHEVDKIKELEMQIKRDPKPVSKEVVRFNIHKRTLPPGIDIIVVFNVTKKEGEWWVEHILKARCYQNDNEDSKTLVYYDVIPVDAKASERSIYHNPPEIIKEEFPDPSYPKRIN